MGVITASEKKEEECPLLPAMLSGVWDKYRSLKFVQRDTGEAIILHPRDTLKWQDLVAFSSVTGETISLLESEIIMCLDAIFEGREDG